MCKRIATPLLAFLLLISVAEPAIAQAPPNAWINEIHYDNEGGDTGEFAEIVLPASFSTLSRVQVLHYNGSDGDADAAAPVTLDEFTAGATSEGFTLYSYDYTANEESLQNGEPDGLALCYDSNDDGSFDTLLSSGGTDQFLSYEGSFTATTGDGCAGDETSTDIGVSESSSTPEGASLGLTGSGDNYSDFSWTTFADDTPGQPNDAQTLPVEFAGTPVATVNGNAVTLHWTTRTETNNLGFHVQHQQAGQSGWTTAGERVEGAGNSTTARDYSYTVTDLAPGSYVFRVKQEDIDGDESFSPGVEATVRAGGFALQAPSQNPFQGRTVLRFSVPEGQQVEAALYNSLGQQVRVLEASSHRIEIRAEGLASGLYFVRLWSGERAATQSITLVR